MILLVMVRAVALRTRITMCSTLILLVVIDWTLPAGSHALLCGKRALLANATGSGTRVT